MLKAAYRSTLVSVALYVLALAVGVVLSKPVAWCLVALSSLVLLFAGADHERTQRYLPWLGRLPFVTDHAAKVRLSSEAKRQQQQFLDDAGAYLDSPEHEQSIVELEESMRLHPPQQLTRRHIESSGDLHDGGDSQVS